MEKPDLDSEVQKGSQYLGYFLVWTLRCWLRAGCRKSWCPSCRCELGSWRELESDWGSWGRCTGLLQCLRHALKWCPTERHAGVSPVSRTKSQTQQSARRTYLTWLLCGVPYRASTRSAALFNSISWERKDRVGAIKYKAPNDKLENYRWKQKVHILPPNVKTMKFGFDIGFDE